MVQQMIIVRILILVHTQTLVLKLQTPHWVPILAHLQTWAFTPLKNIEHPTGITSFKLVAQFQIVSIFFQVACPLDTPILLQPPKTIATPARKFARYPLGGNLGSLTRSGKAFVDAQAEGRSAGMA